jgi:hypothetical protein
MSSGPNPAVHNFPLGTDTYSTMVDRFAIISGESHVIPTTPFQLYLGHLPLQTSPSNISIPGYVEVSGIPGSFQYNLVYSGNSAGLTTFNSAQSLSTVAITYTSAGDIVKSVMLNDLSTSIIGIETYVLSNNPTSGVVHVSGGTMTGNLIMDGSSVIPTISGANNLGLSALPFNAAYANSFFGQELQAGLNDFIKFDANGLTQKSEVIRLEGGTDIYLTTSGSTIYLYATTISISGNIIPTFTGFYDLGSSAKHFGTLYVDNIVTPNGSGAFVHTSGDSMTGNLTMNGASLITDQIDTNTGSIAINASLLNLNSTSDINLLPAAFSQVNVANTLTVSTANVSTNADFTPTASSLYDLGASGNTFKTLYVDNIVGATLSGAFVRSTGDTMTGDLTIQPPAALNVATINSVFGSGVNINAPQIELNATSNINLRTAGIVMLEIGAAQIYQNASIIPTISGTYDIGEPSRPLASLFADNLHAKLISGSTISNATFSGNITLGSGASIILQSSGNGNLGSSSAYFGTIYANNIVTASTSGAYVSKYGDTMTGNLTLVSGSSLLSATSGTSNIGSSNNPFGTVYANNFTTPSGGAIFVLKAGDTMTGPLLLNDLATPSGNLLLSGTNNVNILGNGVIDFTAPQIDITSTSGPVIIDGNTEVQLLQNGSLVVSLNPSGASYYASLFPNVSGTLSVGTPLRPWGAIYADNVYTTAGSGVFVSKFGDSMTGNLVMTSGANVLTSVSGAGTLGSATNPFYAVYANNIFGTSPSGNFVLKTGDVMTGNLVMSGVAVVTDQVTSDTGSITLTAGGGNILLQGGAGTIKLDAPASKILIYGTGAGIDINGGGQIVGISGNGVNLLSTGGKIDINGSGGNTSLSGNGINIGTNSSANVNINASSSADISLFDSGSGRIVISGNSVGGIRTGSNISPLISGVDTLGSSSFPYGTLNVKTIAGASFSSNILMSTSGTINIGSPASPVNNIYAQQLIQPVKTITSSYTVASGDAYVLANHSSAIVVGLPLFEKGYRINFKDQSGLADPTTRKITISGISCQLDGSSTFAIDTNYGRASFIATSGAWFRIE